MGLEDDEDGMGVVSGEGPASGVDFSPPNSNAFKFTKRDLQKSSHNQELGFLVQWLQ
jgi:hypothetical protein